MEMVVLVDRAGDPIGVQSKDEVHGLSTPLHLAFSCHVVDEDGRLLITRRALTKRTWPGVWTTAAELASAIGAAPWAFGQWLVKHLPELLPHIADHIAEEAIDD